MTPSVSASGPKANLGEGSVNSPVARRALIVVGHPDPSSFNHALAAVVEEVWAAVGYDVLTRDLYAERFDPVMSTAEMRGSPTEDAIVRRHQQDLRTSELLAVVHPNCWGAPPAIMKGWIDRVFAPDSAYAFAKGEDVGDAPLGLLTTRAALVLNTGNTPIERERDHFGDPLDRIWRQCLLSYCGVRTIDRALYGVVAGSSGERRHEWLADTGCRARRLVLPPAEGDAP